MCRNRFILSPDTSTLTDGTLRTKASQLGAQWKICSEKAKQLQKRKTKKFKLCYY